MTTAAAPREARASGNVEVGVAYTFFGLLAFAGRGLARRSTSP